MPRKWSNMGLLKWRSKRLCWARAWNEKKIAQIQLAPESILCRLRQAYLDAWCKCEFFVTWRKVALKIIRKGISRWDDERSHITRTLCWILNYEVFRNWLQPQNRHLTAQLPILRQPPPPKNSLNILRLFPYRVSSPGRRLVGKFRNASFAQRHNPSLRCIRILRLLRAFMWDSLKASNAPRVNWSFRKTFIDSHHIALWKFFICLFCTIHNSWWRQ